MHWQINDSLQETIQYYAPNEVQLVMLDCKLVNRKATALRINQGADKQVCAWVECDKLNVLKTNWTLSESIVLPIYYNPRKSVHWNGGDFFPNMDGMGFNSLLTIGKQIHLT